MSPPHRRPLRWVVDAALPLALTLPSVGVLKWKEGLKAVSWNLSVFVGAALVLGHTLIDSGAAQWIITQLSIVTGLIGISSQPVVLLGLILIYLTSFFIHEIPYRQGGSPRAGPTLPR